MFSADQVIQLLDKFVPVAIDSRAAYLEQPFYRHIAEQGHYAGRTTPTRTRQGLYVADSDGAVIESINSWQLPEVIAMLERALARYPKLEGAIPARPTAPVRGADSIVTLTMWARDLPRDDGRVRSEWNLDHIPLNAEALEALRPPHPDSRAYDIPQGFVRWLAKSFLRDIVRGEAPAWQEDQIERVSLHAEVHSLEANWLTVVLRGTMRMEAAPDQRLNPFAGRRVDAPRGLELQCMAEVELSMTNAPPRRLDFVAAGMRWGAAAYNQRFDDLGPAPIGFAASLTRLEAEG